MHRLLQFTLDLFDPAPAAAPASPPRKVAPRRKALPPSEPVDTVDPRPAELLDKVLDAPAFRHARANREALLEGTLVTYEFRRAKRRNIGFTVGPEGLAVTAPKWVPLYEVDSAVQSK